MAKELNIITIAQKQKKGEKEITKHGIPSTVTKWRNTINIFRSTSIQELPRLHSTINMKN